MTRYLKEKDTFYTQKKNWNQYNYFKEKFDNACKVENLQTLHTNISMIDLPIDE